MSASGSPSSAIPEYLETYSLHCAPFENRLDERFFYGGTALMQRLDLVTHLTQFGDSVILVSGPEASGKTTLLSRLITHASNQWLLCLVGVDEFSELPARVAETLDSDEGEDVTVMLEQWAAQTDASQLLVFVIDDAEKLDEVAYQQLCTLLNQPYRDRIRLILFGTPETQSRLKKVLEQKQISCTTQFLEVPRLSEEETAAYLMYRLAVAGYSGESPFTATEVRAICKASDGRPGIINELAHAALVEHQARAKGKRPQLSPDTHRPGRTLAWAAATMLLLVTTAYLAWQRFAEPEPETPAISIADSSGVAERPLPLPESDRTGRTGPVSPTRQPAVEPPSGAEEIESPADATPQAPARQAAGDDSSAPDVQPSVTTPIPTVEPQKVTAAVEAPAPEAPAPEAAAPEAAAPEAAAPEAPAPGESPSATSIPPVADKVTPAIETAVKPEPLPGPAETAMTTAREPPTADAKPLAAAPIEIPAGTPHREDWLLSQPQDTFSLQLLGSRNEKSVLEYIRRNRLEEDKTAYYKGTYRDAEWYVLLYGSYPSRQAALEGRAALPAAVRDNKPWPRSMQSIHQSIREASPTP